ncbi:MAG TPA: 2-keto-4-pentenoate hydratase [Azospirillaceae bacterium]|nr:2-keto-4-pentenoate hydratase [Azospirillaceae bacterium]
MPLADGSLQEISRAFVAARREARALPDFPGEIPDGLDQAYAVQDISIAAWPDRVAGWKIGLVPPPLRARLGAERLSGPIFAGAVWQAGASPVPFPVFTGGFAAVEAEFVFRLAADIPADGPALSDGALAEAAGALHIGVETAGSPLATINDLGPSVVVSDFGNNAGLIVGAEVPGWRGMATETLVTRTLIDGCQVGTGSAASIPGGPLAALRFLVDNLRARGRGLTAGDLISTGATTGVHDIRAGSSTRVEFGRFGHIDAVAVAAGS